MQTGYANSPVSTAKADTPRNRCIEIVTKEIWAELSETINSSVNLADKLRGTSPVPSAQGSVAPEPGDVLSWMERILGVIREVNQQLGHSHNAISG